MTFNGNIHDNSIEFCTFSSDDLSLSAIGLSTYTWTSIEKYFKRTDDEISDYFDYATDIKDKLLALSSPDPTLSLIRFNKETLKYELVENGEIFTTIEGTSVASDLKDMIDKHRQYCLGAITDDTQKKNIQEVVNLIQGSLSGCITFGTEYTVLGGTRKPFIKIHFQNKTVADNSRQVAHKGSPLIVDMPSRATGSSYSYRGTQSSPIGVYQNPFEDGANNPNNAIAAPLDIRYNPSLGKWQSGTHQILAKLLTDVEAAPNINYALDNIDSVDFREFYNIESQQYNSNFATGMAMPLSLENGNPYQFGPNFIGCPESSQPKIEKILVVNRSSRSFKKGDIVICSQIDGEWILQGFDPGTISKAVETKIGKWSFQKYIVNSDNFFKDARYESTGMPNQNITPDVYESKVRLKFYKDFSGMSSVNTTLNNIANIAKLNMYPELDAAQAITRDFPDPDKYDIDLSSKYYQSTIFDQVDSSLGGTNTQRVIGRTNVKVSPIALDNEEDDGYPYQKKLPWFWGPLFPDGYNSSQVGRLKSVQTAIDFVRVSKLYKNDEGIQEMTGISSKFLSIGSFGGFINTLEDVVAGAKMFTDTDDSNAKQLPAEIALNGAKGAYASPIDHPPAYGTNYFNTLHTYLNSENRHSWLVLNSNIPGTEHDDLFGLSPVKPNYIQFSPLQLHAALYGLEITPKNSLQDYIRFNSEVNTFTKGLFVPEALGGSNIDFHSSKFYSRNNLTKNGIIIETDNVTMKATYKFAQHVNRDTVAPLGGASIIPRENRSSERGNVFGVVAAKNKFTAPANGSITLTTRQYFGLSPQVTVAGGQGPNVTILGMFLSWSTGGNSIKENSIPQWGDRWREDKYFSNGTTALHVRIFDQWPDFQTIYDGRYFSVLHFNSIPASGAPNSNIYQIETEIKDLGVKYPTDRPWNPSQINVKYQRTVDKTTCDVDFRVPTFMHPKNASIDNTLVPLGSILTENGIIDGNNFKALRPKSEWKVNQIRRGALLTAGGFRYYKRTIGVNTGLINFAQRGSGYAAGDILNFSKGVKARVSSVTNGGISTIEVIERGEDLDSTDFFGSGIGIINTDGAGVGAQIFFKTGIVYDKVKQDLGPVERVGITRLSLPSNNGKEPADGALSTPISLQGGVGNKYDAFYFMHNDILHTLLFDTAFTPGFAQYIDLEIGAG